MTWAAGCRRTETLHQFPVQLPLAQRAADAERCKPAPCGDLDSRARVVHGQGHRNFNEYHGLPTVSAGRC